MKIKRYLSILSITVWCILVGIGFVWMTDYSFRPGPPANVSARMPEGLLKKSDNNLPKIILFLHPKCPCGRAILDEFEQLVADNPDRAEITVYFLKPAGESDEWVKTYLWERISQIPSVKAAMMNEEEMSQFGVITSGQIILYDAGGNLVFSGGITIGRDHEGESAGREAISTYLQSGDIYIRQTPVFGCALTSFSK